MIYTILDIDNIIFSGFQSSLPIETLQIIRELQLKYEFKETKMAQLPPRRQHHHLKKDAVPAIQFNPNHELEILEKHKNKNELEQDMTKIRVLLNKISKKTYLKLKEQLELIIHPYLKMQSTPSKTEEPDETAIPQIANLVLDVASSNPFMAEMIAELYSDLCKLNHCFCEIVQQWILDYKNSLTWHELSASSLGPEERIKKQQTRKSMLEFFMLLMKTSPQAPVAIRDIVDILKSIMLLVEEGMREINRTHEVEELVDNMCVIHFCCSSFIIEYSIEEWDLIQDKWIEWSNLKPKSLPSISSRSIFLIQDLLN
jgi:hypothetical protein